MPHRSYRDEVLHQLAAEIADLQAQVERAKREQAELDQIAEGTRGRPSHLPASTDVVREMASRVQQLQQIQAMIEKNPDMVHVIDSIIGKHIHAAERRERLLAIILSIVTLIAGWLLSLVRTPSDLFTRLFHLF